MPQSEYNQFITRFAPSPTGYLHCGHAFAAAEVFKFSREHNGRFLLRIEDIDTTRCKPEYREAIFEDMSWLGFEYETPVRIQSEYFSDYDKALQQLTDMGVTYKCWCTRKEIMAANSTMGPEGPIYAGTCKSKQNDEHDGRDYVVRLDLQKAIELLRRNGRYPEVWTDLNEGEIKTEAELLGDVVLRRKDTPTSYHLSVVVDDALQNITHVVRGKDLWHSTHVHVILQALLGYPHPVYVHHDLVLDKDGQKFSKSRQSLTIRSMRDQGLSPEDVINFKA